MSPAPLDSRYAGPHGRTPSLPHAYLQFGDLYLAAAFQLARHCDSQFMPALLQLFGLGIELTLKAYLVQAGVSETKLKGVGHQLGNAFDLSAKSGLLQWCPDLGNRSETFHRWAHNYAGDKSGPNKNHRRLIYPLAESYQRGFGVGDTAIARYLLDGVARALGHNDRIPLWAFDSDPQFESTMASLVRLRESGLFGVRREPHPLHRRRAPRKPSQ